MTLNAYPFPDAEQRIHGAVSIVDLIGNTPLIRLRNLTSHLQNVEVYGKAEYLNPAGSVKDRAAYNMIRHGIDEGKLTKDKIILDSTSGNTGIAYAMIGAARTPRDCGDVRRGVRAIVGLRGFGRRDFESARNL